MRFSGQKDHIYMRMGNNKILSLNLIQETEEDSDNDSQSEDDESKVQFKFILNLN